MWFFCAAVTCLAWGAADLFYKKGADDTDRYSHLKTCIAVGIVMGLHAGSTLLFGGLRYDLRNLLIYLPVSAMYILSMAIGYFGLRYLELSVSSPIQNASGAVTCVLCVLLLKAALDALSAVAVVLICGGVLVLGILEKRQNKTYLADADRKHKVGFLAILIPVFYCIIDALGTFFDAYYLDDFSTTPLVGVTEETFEDVANTSYELTFFLAAVLLFVYLHGVRRQPLTLPHQKDRFAAAVFETAGQFTYVYAMRGRAVVAAPMVASYCIVSVLLSRVFLKEKLSPAQYVTIGVVIAGIVLLGITEGMEA